MVWKAVGLSHRLVAALLTSNKRPPRRGCQGGKLQQLRWRKPDWHPLPKKEQQLPIAREKNKVGKRNRGKPSRAGEGPWATSRRGRPWVKLPRNGGRGTRRPWHVRRETSCWKKDWPSKLLAVLSPRKCGTGNGGGTPLEAGGRLPEASSGTPARKGKAPSSPSDEEESGEDEPDPNKRKGDAGKPVTALLVRAPVCCGCPKQGVNDLASGSPRGLLWPDRPLTGQKPSVGGPWPPSKGRGCAGTSAAKTASCSRQSPCASAAPGKKGTGQTTSRGRKLPQRSPSPPRPEPVLEAKPGQGAPPPRNSPPPPDLTPGRGLSPEERGETPAEAGKAKKGDAGTEVRAADASKQKERKERKVRDRPATGEGGPSSGSKRVRSPSPGLSRPRGHSEEWARAFSHPHAEDRTRHRDNRPRSPDSPTKAESPERQRRHRRRRRSRSSRRDRGRSPSEELEEIPAGRLRVPTLPSAGGARPRLLLPPLWRDEAAPPHGTMPWGQPFFPASGRRPKRRQKGRRRRRQTWRGGEERQGKEREQVQGHG